MTIPTLMAKLKNDRESAILKEDYSIYTENEIEVDLIVKLKNILKEVSEWIKKKYWDYVNF